MRPIWKGQISFGLINVSIELYSAEKRKDLQFKLLDNRNKARIKYERVNEKTGEEVPWDKVVKAYEINKNDYITLDEEDFKQAAVENTQTFEIEDFVTMKSINCCYFEKPYYLVPGKHAEKGYVLLREILKRTEKVAIGKVIIRTRQYLACLLPYGDMLMLDLMRFADEVRTADDLNIPRRDIKDYKISEREINMAEKLVASMTVDWDPTRYHDDYRELLMNRIEEKAKEGAIILPHKKTTAKEKGAEVIDFMELLKKSLQKKEAKSKKSKRNKLKRGPSLRSG